MASTSLAELDRAVTRQRGEVNSLSVRVGHLHEALEHTSAALKTLASAADDVALVVAEHHRALDCLARVILRDHGAPLDNDRNES